MHEEVKETVYVGVNLIILAAILLIVSSGIFLRNQLAATRNEQILTEMQLADYREFNKYQMGECDASCTEHIYGDELIELIRNYYDSDSITIYIDKTGAGGNTLICDRKHYDADRDKYSFKELQRMISPKSEFHTYVVYNSKDPSNVDSVQSPGRHSEVTGVKVVWIKDN